MKRILLTNENAGEVLGDVEKVIRQGGVVILPTDTVYGIVGDARSVRAIQKAFFVKQRSEEKAFPVFIGSIPDARSWAYISDQKAAFLEHVWPGAITVVFQKKGELPRLLTGGKDTLGLRMPDHPFLLRLLSFFDFPLFQTSANISSQEPARTPEDVVRYFGTDASVIDLFIDAGPLVGNPSTVIEFTTDHPIILRSGRVSKAELDRLLGL